MTSLLRTLRAARRRWFAWTVVLAGLAGLSAGSVVVLIGTVASWVGWPASPEAGTTLVAGIAAAFVVAVAYLLRRWRAVPTLVGLASKVDRELAFQDRLATSVELQLRPGGPRTSVERAALTDASERAAHLRPRDVVPFRTGRWTVWLPALAFSTALAATVAAPERGTPVPPAADTSLVGAESSPSHETEPSTERVSHDAVRRVADLLDRIDPENDDPYVQAVGQAFQDLADRMDGEGLDDDALRTEVDELLQHLERAVAERDDAVGDLLRDLAGSGLREAPAQDDVDVAASEPAPEPEPDAVELFDFRLEMPPATNVDGILDELERTAAEAPGTSSDRTPARGEERVPDGQLYGGIFDDEGAPSTPGLGREDAEGVGEVVGDALEADDAAGDGAGDGVFAREGNEPIDAFAGLDAELDEVELTDAPPDPGGARSEGDELVEPSALGGPVDRIDPNAPTDRARSAEGAIGRDVLDDRYHDVVHRYFLPSSGAP